MTITNTTIADLVPSEKVLGQTVKVLMDETNALINSGIVARGPEVNAVANGGPRKASIPFLNPLATDDYNIGSDDINDAGNVGKLTADEFSVIKHVLNYGWGASDLARMVTQYDAKGGIAAGIAQYWNTIFQKIAVAAMTGALAADADLTVGDGTDPLALDLVIDAKVTGGQYMNMFDTLIVSPVTYGKLAKANSSDFIPAAKTDIGFDIWAGLKLIVDTSFGNTSSILARSGALAFGTGSVLNPLEIERVANGGNGQGAEILHSRQAVVIHPQGFNYAATNVAPTTTVIADDASWTLAVPVEQVGFRLISHT